MRLFLEWWSEGEVIQKSSEYDLRVYDAGCVLNFLARWRVFRDVSLKSTVLFTFYYVLKMCAVDMLQICVDLIFQRFATPYYWISSRYLPTPLLLETSILSECINTTKFVDPFFEFHPPTIYTPYGFFFLVRLNGFEEMLKFNI